MNKHISIKRYLPDSAAEPYWQTYDVAVEDSTSLLDALNHIKEQQDSTLSYRWSCRMAICGSCGVMVNGIPKAAVKPYLIEQDPVQTFDPGQAQPHTQTPEQLARYRQFANCINCGLCYSACPQFGLNPEFLGPAALTLAHRYNLDSRDQGKRQRMAQLNRHDGVWSCTFVGFCSQVCPKHVDPAAAVNQGKVEAAKHTLIALFKG